jgi:DNA-binding NarL/FixJ family response regulator
MKPSADVAPDAAAARASGAARTGGERHGVKSRLVVLGDDLAERERLAAYLAPIAHVATSGDDRRKGDSPPVAAYVVAVENARGLAAARDAATSDVPTLALYADAYAAEIARLLRGGLRGALLLDTDRDDVAAALAMLEAGFVVCDPSLVASSAESEPTYAPLTAREDDVFAMLARGAGTRTIAAELRISENTVKYHLNAIYGKLGVATRGEAVAAGVRAGIILL